MSKWEATKIPFRLLQGDSWRKKSLWRLAKHVENVTTIEKPENFKEILDNPPRNLEHPIDKIKKIKKPFPEVALMKNYYRRFPEANKVPINVSDTSNLPARRFALMQLRLMREHNMDKEDAFQRVYAIAREARAKGGDDGNADLLPPEPDVGGIEKYQREEDVALGRPSKAEDDAVNKR